VDDSYEFSGSTADRLVHGQYRARNDMVNPVAAGFVAGGILARNSGPTGALGGGVAFGAFSAAIDLFFRREPAEYVSGPLRSGILLTSYASDD
jgi:Tim17/Tim22/Tim23/Pmp24 family protein